MVTGAGVHGSTGSPRMRASTSALAAQRMRHGLAVGGSPQRSTGRASGRGDAAGGPRGSVGGSMHVLVAGRRLRSRGMSRFGDVDTVGPWIATAQRDDPDPRGRRPLRDLRVARPWSCWVGDMASMPKGAVTTWHLTLPFKAASWFFGHAYDRWLPGTSSPDRSRSEPATICRRAPHHSRRARYLWTMRRRCLRAAGPHDTRGECWQRSPAAGPARGRRPPSSGSGPRSVGPRSTGRAAARRRPSS